MDAEVLDIQSDINTGVVKFNVTDAEIAKMKAEYLPLTINGIQDKAGLQKVYASRQIVKKTSTALIAHANQLKESALDWQRKVNTEKNRVVGELEAIEAHLQGQEDIIEAEKTRIKEAVEKAEAARIQKRVDALAEYGYRIDITFLKSITDEDFNKVVENAKAEHERDLAAKAEAERLAKEEAERLKAERIELDVLRTKQAEAQRIIDAENEKIRKEQEQKEAAIRAEQKKIEDEKTAIELQKQKEIEDKRRAEELEIAIKESAERAKVKALEDAKEAERLAEIDRIEKLNLASDAEKFKSVLTQLRSISIPQMKSLRSKKMSQAVSDRVEEAVNIIESHIGTKPSLSKVS